MTGQPNRRDVLRGVGGTVIGTLAISGKTVAESTEKSGETDDGVRYKQLRGSTGDPISPAQVKQCRQEFRDSVGVMSASDADGDEDGLKAVLDPEPAFRRDEIIDYNVIEEPNGGLREQYIARQSSQTRYRWGTRSTSADTTQTERRLHEKADEMLEETLERDGASVQTTADTASVDDELEWDDLASAGGTDVWLEGPSGRDSARAGRVKLNIDLGASSEYERAGARSRIRMVPGRNLCKAYDNDDYCVPTYARAGYRNKNAAIKHDWNQLVNEFDASELITDMAPAGQMSDVTTTESFSLGLDISRGGGLSVGYSSSITMPGASLYEKSNLKAGVTMHELSADPNTASAKYPAVFEVASTAKYSKDDDVCHKGRPPYRHYTFLEIGVNLTWALKIATGLPKTGWWGASESDDRKFTYETVC